MIKNPLNSLTNLSDSKLELEDPNPNIWEMFHDFDLRFFKGHLVNHGVIVDWSSKMTLCAGLCRWNPRELSCTIKLSKPLLQLRSRKDLVETLIHEMIHALLFVLRESDNRESHGPKFQQTMYRINQEANLNISVYHTFHDEVRHYQTHVWRCKGTCKNKPPYFGYVRRALNRKPGTYDTWWTQHQQTCGGEFEKISEPENYGKKASTSKVKETNEKKKINDNVSSNSKTIKDFFTPTPKKLTKQDKTENVLVKQEKTENVLIKQEIIGNILIKQEKTEPILIDLENSQSFNDSEIEIIDPFESDSKQDLTFKGRGNLLGKGKNPIPGTSILLQKFNK